MHPYKEFKLGRGIIFDGRTRTRTATIKCNYCAEVGELNMRSLLPPEVLDKKFHQKGWALDPNSCPNCNTKNQKEKPEVSNTTMSENPILRAVSADTHKATARMHQMLANYFDEAKGVFADGWGDERIAKETGLAAAHVAEVRSVAYGDIKEPEEITKLRADLNKIDKDLTEMLAMAQKEVTDLKKQLAELTKKLGVK